MGLNQHSRQGSVVIRIEMGAADLTSLVMAAQAEVEAFGTVNLGRGLAGKAATGRWRA